MTKVLQKTDKVSIINLQNPKSEGTPGFRDKTDKSLLKASRSRDLECPSTTCYQYSRYPSGCIVLECRLEADRPVVWVVQVPAEATARNSCLPVKTRSTFDPSSRMTSRCQDTKQRIDSIDVCSRGLPASHILKSQDCTDDSIALTDKLPKKDVSTVILEIDRDEKQFDDAKIATSKKILETSYCDDRSRDQSVIFIKYAAIPCKDFLSTQYSDTDVSRQKLKATSSSPDCKCACSDQEIDISSEMDDAFSQMTCRNGADPSKISSSSKKSLKRFTRQIYPISCCHPVQQIKEACKDFLHAKSSASDATFVGKDDQRSLDEQQLQCPLSERMLRTEVTRVKSAKSDKAFTCQRSATASRDACLILGRISEETSPLSNSEDLVRYKKYIPIHLLEKYEICRSRRNGLQDECVLPFLQTILKKEKRGHLH